MELVREPIGVGLVYPREREEIEELLREAFTSLQRGAREPPRGVGRVLAYIVPHGLLRDIAGVAAAAYQALNVTKDVETFVLVGPNHSGRGALVAVYPGGVWVTPLGTARVDEEFAMELVSVDDYAELDDEAHEEEYSLELQLIFLQYLLGERFRFVAVSIADMANPEIALSLAKSIAATSRALGRGIAVIATSEVGYYPSPSDAGKAVSMVKECIRDMDHECFYRVVRLYNVYLCAPAALATATSYSRIIGADTARAEIVGETMRSNELGQYAPYFSAILYQVS